MCLCYIYKFGGQSRVPCPPAPQISRRITNDKRTKIETIWKGGFGMILLFIKKWNETERKWLMTREMKCLLISSSRVTAIHKIHLIELKLIFSN